MKPSIFDRFLLALWCLVGMAAGVGFLLMAVGIFPYGAQVIAGILEDRLITGIAGALVFLVSLRLLIGFNKRGKENGTEKQTATTAVISSGDYGTVQITLAAIDSMVQRHCRANSKIREATSVVSLHEGGIKVDLKLSLLSDANVPAVTEELQKTLKAYLEGLTGIQVNDISILVICAPAQQALQK